MTCESTASPGLVVLGSLLEHLGTPASLMLTLAVADGFFIPVIFGHLVAPTNFTFGLEFLAVMTFVFALAVVTHQRPAVHRRHADQHRHLEGWTG